MQAKISECVAGVFCDVLEHLAFMFADAVRKEETPGLSENGYSIGMSFAGPLNGSLVLAAPREAGREIAANILGMDSSDEQAERGAEDALKELLNVTCGRLLTALAGDGPVFHLSVPEAKPCAPLDWGRLLAERSTYAFQADDYWLLLCVKVESEE